MAPHSPDAFIPFGSFMRRSPPPTGTETKKLIANRSKEVVTPSDSAKLVSQLVNGIGLL